MSDFWEKIWSEEESGRIRAYFENFDTSEDQIIRYLLQTKAKTVCDAGCGCGAYTLKLLRYGFCVHGFDISPSAVSIAKTELIRRGCGQTEIKQADVLNTGYEDGAFDAAVSLGVIDHLPYKDAKAAVKELLRIIKPGGTVILTLDKAAEDYLNTPHDENPYGDLIFTAGKRRGTVFHPFTLTEIKEFAKNQKTVIFDNDGGFSVIITKS